MPALSKGGQYIQKLPTAQQIVDFLHFNGVISVNRGRRLAIVRHVGTIDHGRMKNVCGHGHNSRRTGEQGFSLIEVVVAVAIFSAGLGGLSLLLLLALQETAASRFQTYAHSQAHSMAEFITTSPGAASDASTMVAAALHRWRLRLADTLPEGDGLICRDSTPQDGTRVHPACDGAGPLHVKVFWSEPAAGSESTPSVQRAVARVPLL